MYYVFVNDTDAGSAYKNLKWVLDTVALHSVCSFKRMSPVTLKRLVCKGCEKGPEGNLEVTLSSLICSLILIFSSRF